MLRGCFGKSGQPTSVLQGAVGATYTYNAFGQMSQTAVGANSSGTVSPVVTYVPGYERFFVNGVYSASNRITSWTVTNGGSSTAYAYTYDTRSNITSASDGTHTTTYAYDGKDQLTRENNQAAGKTWVYTYDNGGNILSKTEYAYTTGALGTPLDTIAYTYGDSTWGDLLTAYDGVSLTCDEIGNLTGDGTWSYTWQHARQLAGMSDGTTSLSFAYNADGQRVSKTVGGTTYNYTYANGVLTHMQWGNNSMHFVYDALGAAAVVYNGTTYYYLRNAQGDITGLVNTSGTQVVSYTYDAWGKLLSTTGTLASTLGVYNPLRYRGYFYDTETGLYYLMSRYYNPSWGRFINADIYVSTGQGIVGSNMFAYCNNNPMLYTDYSGEIAGVDDAVLLCIATVCVLVFVGYQVIVSNTNPDYVEDIGQSLLSVFPLFFPPILHLDKAPTKTPDVKYPGNDPKKAPEGTEWKGKGEQGSKEGNYTNPQTGESWHPDLDHPDPIGPHWDYNYRNSGTRGWRVFPDGRIVLKGMVRMAK